MKKKFISLITAFSLMFMIFNLPVDVFAANSPTSGDCGNNVTWEYNSSAKTLTISGSGAMVNYEYGGNQPWYSYHKEITTVVIQDGVTHIGNNAFWFLNNLTAVTIPKSVTTIGDNAFSSCSSLTSITFPGDVTDIGKSAFSSCNAITKIKLDSTTTVPELRDYALDGCSSNMKVVVPPEMKEDYLTAEGWWANHKDKIVPAETTSGYCGKTKENGGKNVTWTLDNNGTLTISGSGNIKHYDYAVFSPFYNDGRIKNVVINDGVTRIGKYTFEGCRSLESIAIPNSVNYIGYSSFGNCNSLKSITVSNNVTQINANAFSGCTSLSNVTLSEGALYNIGNYAFWGCNSLSSVTIPNSVTTMGEFAFSSCTSLSNVKLSNKLTSISQGAFYGCNFSSVEIPQSVTSIGLNAFAKNTNLSSVTIPSNVTVLEGIAEYGGAFDGCTSLGSVKFEGTTTIPTLKENTFRNCKFFTDNDETTGITLPSCEYLSAYLNTSGWDTYKEYILTKHNTGDWASDETNHWHECSVCNNETDKEKHTWDSGVTDDTTGDITYTCSVCEATKTDTHTHTHTFTTDWTTDDDYHWHAATCEHTSEVSGKAEHTEDSGTVTLQPTETTTGTKIFKCSVCGYVMRTETVPVTGVEHVHDFGTDWKYDNTNHWHECICGEKSDLAAHSENGGVVTLAPTETTNGEITYRCTVCGTITRTETIPATGVIPVPTPTPVPPSPPVTYPDSIVFPVITDDNDEPFIVDNRSIEGWEAISEDIHITADGGFVDVDMNGTDILPQDIIEDIAGRDIDLILEMGGGITWTINGLTVTNAQRTNMKVYIDKGRIPNDILDTVSDGEYVKELTLKHTGEFGFTPVLTVKMPKRFEGKCANLFYYDPKYGEMEFVNFGMIENGAVKLAFNHASEYAVVVSDAPMGGEDISVSAGTFDNDGTIGTVSSNYASYCGIIIISIIGTGILAIKKRKQK